MPLSDHQIELAEWFSAQRALKEFSRLVNHSNEMFKDLPEYELMESNWERPEINEVRDLLIAEFNGTTFLDFIIHNQSNKFNDVSPDHFEDFICFLLTVKGYAEATITSDSSDYGVDIICETLEEEEWTPTALMVKRNEDNRKVGVNSLNQLLGGKDFYDCQKAIMVTTSGLTKNAIELAEKTNTEVWNWEELDEYIQNDILLGYPYHEFKAKQPNQPDNRLEVSISCIEQNVETTSREISVRIRFHIMNTGSSTIEILGLSTDSCLIKSNGFQINNISIDSDSFQKGRIYSNSYSELGVFIPQNKAGKISNGDRFILELLGKSQDYSFELDLAANPETPPQSEVVKDKYPTSSIVFIVMVILIATVLTYFFV